MSTNSKFDGEPKGQKANLWEKQIPKKQIPNTICDTTSNTKKKSTTGTTGTKATTTTNIRNIRDIARVIRSKNAGPYELTLDIIFNNSQVFNQVKKNDVITFEKIARLYNIKTSSIHDIIFFPPANAVKIVMDRRIVSGSPGDTDVYGAQQHAPLLSLEFADLEVDL